MKRDILALSGGTIALGAVLWIFWGNPVNAPRTPISHQHLQADPVLKLVSENSPYMRTER
jgi:hypothetical protein